MVLIDVQYCLDKLFLILTALLVNEANASKAVVSRKLYDVRRDMSTVPSAARYSQEHRMSRVLTDIFMCKCHNQR
jgi:hypothetical protein